MARKRTKPRCYHGCDKPARKNGRFCSQKCAAEFAEELVLGNDDKWCSNCQEWVDNEGHECSHKKS